MECKFCGKTGFKNKKSLSNHTRSHNPETKINVRGSKNPNWKGGIYKGREKEYRYGYWIKNKEKILNQQSKRRKKNRERYLKKDRKWRKLNREKVRANQKRYRLRNKEKVKKYAEEYRKKYPERDRAKSRAHYKNLIDDFCSKCENAENLDFHHTNYEKDEGMTLCKSCHKLTHLGVI